MQVRKVHATLGTRNDVSMHKSIDITEDTLLGIVEIDYNVNDIDGKLNEGRITLSLDDDGSMFVTFVPYAPDSTLPEYRVKLAPPRR